MDIVQITRNYNRFRFGEDNFHELMRHKVRRILLVSTFYDAFILEQDGHLAEQIRVDYRQLKLTSAPRITTVPTADMALQMVQKRSFDLVITLMRIGGMTPFAMADEIKKVRPNLPVVLLLNVASDLAYIDKSSEDMAHIDDVFLWRGDSMLFLAMLKCLEDKINAPHDTLRGLVRVILLVEDNIPDYSRFLPLLYTEVMKQTQLNISEERHVASRTLRMRARPKVLLAHTYEQAWEIYERYKDFLLCIISDVEYPRNGQVDKQAGIELIKNIRKEKKTLPACLQSTVHRYIEDAMRLGTSFLHKPSPKALRGLKLFIEGNLGFGDFIFRDKKGTEISRAATMREFEERLRTVPTESLYYHARRDHFSTWLIARGELDAARRLKPILPEDFESTEANRRFLIKFFEELRTQKDRGRIVDFDKSEYLQDTAVLRLGGGSFGGKGRGLAFLNAFISAMSLEDSFEDVKVKIPRTAIIGTEEFDIFVEKNNLARLGDVSDDEAVKMRFLEGSFSKSLDGRLRELCEVMKTPVAVRSSSLLEDSQSQPFAGVYQTFMLPNMSEDPQKRYEELCKAVKLVYASGYLARAREYFDVVEYGLEEEKMAVIIQEVVGSQRGQYYYPHFSGVACSYDYYPMPFMKNTDGIARLAVGLGRYIVGGCEGYRFCPVHPTRSTRASDEIPKSNQWEFYAIDLSRKTFNLAAGEEATLVTLPIRAAEEQGVLWQLASTYDANSNRIIDGISGKGPRVIDFSGILKAESFPLAEILKTLLLISEQAMGVPVELEFAVNLDRDHRRKDPSRAILPTFYLLQIRPLLTHGDEIVIDEEEMKSKKTVLLSSQAMGNDEIIDIDDVVFVKPHSFDKTKTSSIAQQVASINEKMKKCDKRYVLIGPGRWGTRDRFLGIPVQWGEINRARVIVEVGLPDFSVEASQGTHFFHNLLALNVGYLTVPYVKDEKSIDYDWLRQQTIIEETDHLLHVQSKEPLLIKIDGRHSRAVILRQS